MVYCYLHSDAATHFISFAGQKIACFAPESFSDTQAEALSEHCWNNGYWVSEGVPLKKTLYTQPHRFYPLYLPLQAIVMMIPIVFWNVNMKSILLSVLRGTEEFLENLVELLGKNEETEAEEIGAKVREHIRQFHTTMLSSARTSHLSLTVIMRVFLEMGLGLFILVLQFFIFNHRDKEYVCSLDLPAVQLEAKSVPCTVPILDLLDLVWTINMISIITAVLLNMFMLSTMYKAHFSDYQPLFYSNLPYADGANLDINIVWDSSWTKDSYRLLTRLFQENNPIMTKAYVLNAMKAAQQGPVDDETKPNTPLWDNFKGAVRKRVLRETSIATSHTPDDDTNDPMKGM